MTAPAPAGVDPLPTPWRTASALLQCAQLAYNADSPRKQSLYERAHAAMAQHAALSDELTECLLPTAAGDLRGWVVCPRAMPASAAVVVIGGLNGWGAAYLDMGRALAARGMLAVLAEGPGQGLSRMQSGLLLDQATLPLLGHFIDHAGSRSARQFGAWGNSFGGLFAARLAVHDARVRAVCINGAPMRPELPPFRTAREQMHAAFGTASAPALAAHLAALALDPRVDRTAASLLVVEGGRDPLVALGTQSDFFGLSPATERSILTWNDGEHTIYNHAQ